MARTIAEIKQSITDNVNNSIPGLSGSQTAEWGLWAYIMAAAIHAFEVILDLFKQEINSLTSRITPGTIRWYAEMCKRFQNGDSLMFDEDTALLYYPETDEKKQIIAMAAVSETKDEDGTVLSIKVAKKDAQGHIVELNQEELYNFQAYIDAVKFAGCRTEVISTNADRIYYDLTVYHDPAIPSETVKTDTEAALEQFKVSIDFDGVLYRQKLIDAVMGVNGVTTCVLNDLAQHSSKDNGLDAWHPIDTHATLEAGYFDWADGSKSDDATPDKPEEAENGDESEKETESGDAENQEAATPATYDIGPDGKDTASEKKCRLTVKTINELLNTDKTTK